MQAHYWLIIALFALGGCAATPQNLRGEFSALTPQTAQDNNANGQLVRWGGELIKATPGPNETCFELLGRALDANGRPASGDKTLGRFLACAPGFYDPTVYTANRELTVTGTLTDPVTRKVGNYDYHYPQVAAQAVYLWPKRAEIVHGPWDYRDPFYDPFFSPFGYGHHRNWPYYW
ncbi:MAG: Slp family lipoprotein [Gammaproteobacteria bacterium]